MKRPFRTQTQQEPFCITNNVKRGIKVTFLFFLASCIAIVLTAGCGGQVQDGKDKSADAVLKVVATTGMIGDAVRVIADDKVSLTTLMGPGVDPHYYKAARSDLDRLDNADVIFYNGLNLEAKMADILKKMGRLKTTVAVGESIPDTLLRYPAGSAGHPDPHIWFDVMLWSQAVEKVGQVLAEADPPHAEFYLNNAQEYLDSLKALDNWIRERIASIPKRQRVLVTAHDAFGYFGLAYDIEVKGLQGLSTVTEAGLYDVTRMVDMLIERNIKAVFVESSVSKKAINAVVEGCRSRGHEVVIGGELFSDAMGEAGTVEGTYLGMVRHNVNTIVEALK
jgi:manganese/zinc/iron transport system substrate-binding protein